jgi:CheY-like chemotaxis protein
LEATQAETVPKLSLLLCDDEPLIRMYVADVLRQLGHAVTETATALEAKAALAAGQFDVLVADVRLPDISGVELARIARAMAPAIGVVLTTGDSGVPEAAEIASAVVLLKPFGEIELGRAVKNALS